MSSERGQRIQKIHFFNKNVFRFVDSTMTVDVQGACIYATKVFKFVVSVVPADDLGTRPQ